MAEMRRLEVGVLRPGVTVASAAASDGLLVTVRGGKTNADGEVRAGVESDLGDLRRAPQPGPGADKRVGGRLGDSRASRRSKRATLAAMEVITPWLTPALFVALVAWLRSELISRTDKLEKRFDGVDKRFDAVNKRFDGVTREIADLRERMAKLEGALEGFLAGRRDRDAA